MEFAFGICLHAYNQNVISTKLTKKMNENNRIKTESKPMKKSSTMVAATIVAIGICATLTIGIQTQISYQALAETYSATSNGMIAGPSHHLQALMYPSVQSNQLTRNSG